jgi:hypothetical protein
MQQLLLLSLEVSLILGVFFKKFRKEWRLHRANEAIQPSLRGKNAIPWKDQETARSNLSATEYIAKDCRAMTAIYL